MKYRARRYITDVFVNVREGETLSRTQIHDISPQGARMIGRCQSDVGTILTLEHLNARLPAKVCWRRENSYGIVFTSALDLTRLNTLRASRRGGKRKTFTHQFTRG